MDFGIQGKTELVCAGSKGIGRACAEALSAEGARVAICARNEKTLADTAKEISAKSGNPVLPVRADVTRAEEIDALFSRIGIEFGTLHILVTNAGGPPASDFGGAADDDWGKAFELTFLSA